MNQISTVMVESKPNPSVNVSLGNLKGRGLAVDKSYPTMKELREIIPKRLTEKSLPKSLMYLAFSVSSTLLCFYLGTYIPMNLYAGPLWAI